MSFRKYKIIDLAIFTGLYLLLEFLISLAATRWFPEQPYSVSIMLPILLIVMMRWGPYVGILAAISAPFYVLIYHGANFDYLVYLFGNIGFMGLLGFLLPIGKKKVRDSILLTLAYIVIGFLLLEVFRGFGAMIFKGVGIQIAWQFIWTDMLSLVFSIVVIMIMRFTDGIFEDQKAYLFRKQREREAEEAEKKELENYGGEH